MPAYLVLGTGGKVTGKAFGEAQPAVVTHRWDGDGKGHLLSFFFIVVKFA